MTLPYFDLSGKTAIITGGSKGLGEQMAYAFAEAGADVAIVSRTQADLDAVSSAVHAATGRNVVGVAADVTKDADIQAMVQAVMAEFGQIDILINNAGIGGTTPMHELTEEEVGSFYEPEPQGPRSMLQACRGRDGQTQKGQYYQRVFSVLENCRRVIWQPTGATKAALVSFTRTLALEWARDNIRVNALCPGYFDTPMNHAFWETKGGKGIISRIPMQRVGDPKELKPAIIFLSSDANTFMTGTTLFVDGGHSLVG